MENFILYLLILAFEVPSTSKSALMLGIKEGHWFFICSCVVIPCSYIWGFDIVTLGGICGTVLGVIVGSFIKVVYIQLPLLFPDDF